MSLYPRVEDCPTRFCQSGETDEIIHSFDTANYLIRMAIEIYGQSAEDYTEIVMDLERVVCVPGECHRLAAIYDALSEMGVLDAMIISQIDPQPVPEQQTSWQLGWLEVERE
jgi:hypothetical protein